MEAGTGFVWGSVSSFGESVAVRGEPKAMARAQLPGREKINTGKII